MGSGENQQSSHPQSIQVRGGGDRSANCQPTSPATTSSSSLQSSEANGIGKQMERLLRKSENRRVQISALQNKYNESRESHEETKEELDLATKRIQHLAKYRGKTELDQAVKESRRHGNPTRKALFDMKDKLNQAKRRIQELEKKDDSQAKETERITRYLEAGLQKFLQASSSRRISRMNSYPKEQEGTEMELKQTRRELEESKAQLEKLGREHARLQTDSSSNTTSLQNKCVESDTKTELDLSTRKLQQLEMSMRQRYRELENDRKVAEEQLRGVKEDFKETKHSLTEATLRVQQLNCTVEHTRLELKNKDLQIQQLTDKLKGLQASFSDGFGKSKFSAGC